MRRSGSRYSSQRGFTLVEIMVVLIIISILMTVLYGKILGAGDRAKVGITNMKIKQIQSDIEQYRLQFNNVPPSLDSLAKCPDNGGSGCIPVETNPDALTDGWNRPFAYSSSGDGRSFVIKSFGADGVEGGSGLNSDIVSQGP